MYRADDGTRLSVSEQMLVHVDSGAGRSSPIPGPVHAALSALHTRHLGLPAPAEVGRTMRIVRAARD
jgi:acyl-CoA thioester hydrolase